MLLPLTSTWLKKHVVYNLVMNTWGRNIETMHNQVLNFSYTHGTSEEMYFCNKLHIAYATPSYTLVFNYRKGY